MVSYQFEQSQTNEQVDDERKTASTSDIDRWGKWGLTINGRMKVGLYLRIDGANLS